MIYLHNSLRKYVSAVLNFFNEMKIQYKNSEGDVIERNIPVDFSLREKSDIIDEKTQQSILSGNTNVLPRAYITWSAINRDDTRLRNRNNKINVLRKENSIEYQYNSMPYSVVLEYHVICRGMTEACQVLEELVPYFNPLLNLDIYDGDNLDKPTRVPVQLLDANLEPAGFDEYSNNNITVNATIQAYINIFSPVKSIENIKTYKLSFHGNEEDRFKTIGYDVHNGKVDPETGRTIDKYAALSKLQVGFKTKVLEKGDNTIYTFTQKHKLDDIRNFKFTVLQSEIEILSVKSNSIKIRIPEDYKGNIEVIFEVEDEFSNKQACSRMFKI